MSNNIFTNITMHILQKNKFNGDLNYLGRQFSEPFLFFFSGSAGRFLCGAPSSLVGPEYFIVSIASSACGDFASHIHLITHLLLYF